MEPIYLVAGSYRSFSNMAIESLVVGSRRKLRPIYTPGRHDRYGVDFDDEHFKFNDGRLFELEWCPACRRRRWLQANRRAAERRMSRPKLGLRRARRALRRRPKCADPDCLSALLHNPELGAGRLVKFNISSPVWDLPPANYKLLVLLRDWEEVSASWGALGQEAMPPAQHYLATCGFFLSAPMNATDKVFVWSRDMANTSSLRRFQTWCRIRDLGWPIDPMAAAGVYREDLDHFQRDRLAPGAPRVLPIDRDPAKDAAELLGVGQ